MRTPTRWQRAWWWVTGLRIQTPTRRELEREELDRAHAYAKSREFQAELAERQKRQAQRLLVLLSEPLKDWDLADFPAWATSPDKSVGFTRDYPLSGNDGLRVWELVQAYRMLAPELAQVRMTSKTNDSARRRGWADQPLPAETFRPPLDPRRLP